MLETRCVLCEADFRADAMVDGKCPVCATMYPGVKSRDELKLRTSPNKARTLTENVVQQMIYDTLEEAGIKRVACERCKKLFFRTSPAQKYCLACREKEAK